MSKTPISLLECEDSLLVLYQMGSRLSGTGDKNRDKQPLLTPFAAVTGIRVVN